ncbi:MAG: dephospho-CoA kinase [Candidatus Margulisbacteria bacterium]|nr:dephospho-CoA kinase [Candidatus Margulisiibacteriota bacterium]
MIIGVTGIIGSGKSTAALLLARRLRARVLDADRIGREVLAGNHLVRFCLRCIFGSLERGVIARQAFASRAKLFWLNALTHPWICGIIRRRLRAGGDWVLDAPLLFQAGLAKDCDYVILLTARRPTLIRRLSARGYTAAQIRQRLAAGRDTPRYRRRAAAVIANDGSLADLKKALRAIPSELS